MTFCWHSLWRATEGPPLGGARGRMRAADPAGWNLPAKGRAAVTDLRVGGVSKIAHQVIRTSDSRSASERTVPPQKNSHGPSLRPLPASRSRNIARSVSRPRRSTAPRHRRSAWMFSPSPRGTSGEGPGGGALSRLSGRSDGVIPVRNPPITRRWRGKTRDPGGASSAFSRFLLRVMLLWRAGQGRSGIRERSSGACGWGAGARPPGCAPATRSLRTARRRAQARRHPPAGRLPPGRRGLGLRGRPAG
jgi:hypothetical protein